MAPRVISVYDLANLFDLPSHDSFREANEAYISNEAADAYQGTLAEGGSEGAALTAEEKALSEAERELFEQWRGAVEDAASQVFNFHHLDIRLRDKPKIPWEFRIEPDRGKTWGDAAAQLATTIKGVGTVMVPAEDYSSAPMRWVLKHLSSLGYTAAVWGSPDPNRIYYQSFR